MDYGKGLTKAREMAGLSKRALACRVGVKPSYITHIEVGRRVPSVGVLERLADALELPMLVFLWHCMQRQDIQGIPLDQAQAIAGTVVSHGRMTARGQ